MHTQEDNVNVYISPKILLATLIQKKDTYTAATSVELSYVRLKYPPSGCGSSLYRSQSAVICFRARTASNSSRPRFSRARERSLTDSVELLELEMEADVTGCTCLRECDPVPERSSSLALRFLLRPEFPCGVTGRCCVASSLVGDTT